MKVIVAGSRTIESYASVCDAISKSGFCITELVSGGQRSWDRNRAKFYGVDYFGEVWARHRKIPIMRFDAEWDKFGKAAGPMRNRKMAKYADALIAVWNGSSKGTYNMILEMENVGKPVYRYII